MIWIHNAMCSLLTALAVVVLAADDWLHPTLPTTLRPVSYDVWLCPDFYDGAAVFNGRVDIAVEVLTTTRTVIVHYKDINIIFTAITDHDDNIIPVSRLYGSLLRSRPFLGRAAAVL